MNDDTRTPDPASSGATDAAPAKLCAHCKCPVSNIFEHFNPEIGFTCKKEGGDEKYIANTDSSGTHAPNASPSATQGDSQPLGAATGGDWAEDFYHENGRYGQRCPDCGIPFTGHKRRVICKLCATRPIPADPKAEALQPTPECDENAGQMLQRLGIDGMLWAKEFVSIQGGDLDLMLSWFCNAIMAGYDEAMRRREREITALEGMLGHAVPAGVELPEVKKNVLAQFIARQRDDLERRLRTAEDDNELLRKITTTPQSIAKQAVAERDEALRRLSMAEAERGGTIRIMRGDPAKIHSLTAFSKGFTEAADYLKKEVDIARAERDALQEILLKDRATRTELDASRAEVARLKETDEMTLHDLETERDRTSALRAALATTARVVAVEEYCTITLTTWELLDLAKAANLVPHNEQLEGPDDGEIEYTIFESKTGVDILDDDKKPQKHRHGAWITEYPEEGTFPLGTALLATHDTVKQRKEQP